MPNMVDEEYEFAEELSDVLMEILEHNWKYGVEEQFPDLKEIDDRAYELAKKVREHHQNYL